MNRLNGQIKEITVSGSLSLVAVELSDLSIMQSIVIDTPDTASYLHQGADIQLLFKETEVILGTAEAYQISLQNRIMGHVVSIEKGTLISKVSLATAVGDIIAVISTAAAEQLSLSQNMDVLAMIKQNQIMLSS